MQTPAFSSAPLPITMSSGSMPGVGGPVAPEALQPLAASSPQSEEQLQQPPAAAEGSSDPGHSCGTESSLPMPPGGC